MSDVTISLSLPLPAIRAILRALGRQPYDDVVQIIDHIVSATNDQIEAAKARPEPKESQPDMG